MKNNSNLNVNTRTPELSSVSNKVEQKEPAINILVKNITKQERKTIKRLHEVLNLIIKENGKCNPTFCILVIYRFQILDITSLHFYDCLLCYLLNRSLLLLYNEKSKALNQHFL